jgi:hypothetical protein
VALSTVIASKDANYAPILLASLTFADGSMLYLSTHAFNAGEGGSQYQGNDYLSRIAEQDISQVQARSEQGIDRISEVTLHLYNADQYLLTNYEQASGKGFKGAILKLALVLCDIDSSGAYVFSTDSTAPVKFQGICEAPQGENASAMLSVRATTSHNLGRVDFPILHVQQRCINVFPRNASERLAGATDISAWQWGCGYNPDQTGTDPEIGGDCRRGSTTTAGATDAQGRVIADGSGNFITCSYTKADCVARGMYSRDASARATGRFTAIQWAPAQREGRSKSYTQGKNVTVFSSRNDSIYSRSYPMLYGTQWIKTPIIANILGDGNSTRMEVVVCVGDVSTGIQQVVVNGVIVPANGAGADPLFRWNFLDGSSFASTHTGGRNGIATADKGYDSNGDPYGSLATIEIVVYSELAQSNSAPDVRILCSGPRLVKYAPIATYNNGLITLPSGVPNADIAGNPPFTVQILGCSLSAANGVFGLTSWAYGPPGTVTLTSGPSGTGTGGYIRYLVRSNNPAWVVFDLLIWGNYNFTELDVDSFVAAGIICDQSVSYLDLNGNSATHARFICELTLEDRRKGNEVIQSVLRSFNAQLVPNSETGKLQLFIRQTLADQQPASIPGSNYTTAVKSMHADGTAGNGYVAYLIDESVIQADDKGMPKIRGPYTPPSSQTPNAVSFPFQNSENAYSDDSISVTDPDDVARAAGYQLGGQVIPAGYPVLGVSNFDQGIRIANVILAEGLRGNAYGDTRGSQWFDIETTHRLEHVHVGQVILLRYAPMGLSPATPLQSPSGTNITGILARVEGIKPTTDYRRMTLTVRRHEDLWYTDSYGQYAAPAYSDPAKSLPARPPYPWKPYGQQPIASDPLYGSSEWNFQVAQQYETAADGGVIAKLAISGCPPVNQFGSVQPPLMGLQGSTASTGGTIAGGIRLIMAISVKDSSGAWSPLSKFAYVDIPSGTNTNTAVTPTINWQAGTQAYVLYVGTSEQTMCQQAAATGSTPSTITITSLNVGTYGAPDPLFASFTFRVKRNIHAGVWGAQLPIAPTTNTLKFTGASFSTNQWQNYVISLVGRPGSTSPLPIADFTVSSNTADTLTVTPDPVAPGILLGDVFVMRTRPSTHTGTTIGDANFVNFYGGSGLTADAEKGNLVRIIRGTGAGQAPRTIVSNTSTVLTVTPAFDIVPDATSIFIVEEPAWQTSLETGPISSASLNPSPAPFIASINVDNFRNQTLVVQALTEDPSGNTSLERYAPLREIYLFGGQGTRAITATTTGGMLATDRVLKFDTSGVTQPATDSLNGAINSSQTNVTVTSGANVVNGTVIHSDSEDMYVDAGGGTANLTVQRGWNGTTPASHSNGATVIVPGALAWTLLSFASVPNQDFVFSKISTDINYVKLIPSGSDQLPDGETYHILPDSSAQYGTYGIQIPGA